ncbi:MAG TPA: KUP/HAK/KT family potassium transporter [Chitinophagales bacterium]|nr:KUP/HAK/KT family potassium transporter [Chitinophagales bacterium]
MEKHVDLSKLSIAGVFITLGIIFGDIGTSPLYVFKAVIGSRTISDELILGGISCVFWTLLLITTFKYVILALTADNHGEGGIFALYGLVKEHKFKWTVIAAFLGCSALMADGFITPPISILSAVEGLNVIFPKLPTLPIGVTILVLLFSFQRFGTDIVGKTFGPVMFVWFTVIALLGIHQILQHPEIMKAINPFYGIHLLIKYPGGFWILGAVFLCTTGAEALYADLGHCGKLNIRFSWTFVWICLLLNYFGQGAWLLDKKGTTMEDVSIFYAIVPKTILPFIIALATVATIIASQALISGCFTLVNEAIKLRLWINHKVTYPSSHKGQIYISSINWFLFAGCMVVVFAFRKSYNMEAAYGLTIIINMLMTSALLLVVFSSRGTPKVFLLLMGILFFVSEIAFFISNLKKFFYGGWFTLLVCLCIFLLLYFLRRARKLRSVKYKLVNLDDYTEMFNDLINDETIPKAATNLVFMSKKANTESLVDSNIIYSLFQQNPKRADVYWIIHVEILDYPNEHEKNYSVSTIIPEKLFLVNLQFGFKVKHNVQRLFKRIVEEMSENKEVDALSRYASMRKHNIPADFKYVFVKPIISADNDLEPVNKFSISVYEGLNKIAYPLYMDFGLDTVNVVTEIVPIHFHIKGDLGLKRKQ